MPLPASASQSKCIITGEELSNDLTIKCENLDKPLLSFLGTKPPRTHPRLADQPAGPAKAKNAEGRKRPGI